MLFNIHKSSFYTSYEENEFYSGYIIFLIKQFLLNNKDIQINITLNENEYNFNNNNKTIKININFEHTLVKQGGRTTYNAPVGNIKTEDNNNYLVRIDQFNKLNTSDIIIDYSNPNIHNVKMSNLFEEFSKKHIYISPIEYDLYLIKEERSTSTLTTFLNPNESRRKIFLEKIKEHDIKNINVNTCFLKEDLQALYKNTKILINIHQTDHHHTIEELRILPALQTGVLVISETSPLNHLVPYNDYIIWSSYDTIFEKIKDVINNYDYYHDLIFKRDHKILEELNDINSNTLNNKIMLCV